MLSQGAAGQSAVTVPSQNHANDRHKDVEMQEAILKSMSDVSGELLVIYRLLHSVR